MTHVPQVPARFAKYQVGDKVRKTKGYEYPGVIVAVFATTKGDLRYVVEHRISIGMLHIFNEEQLDDA